MAKYVLTHPSDRLITLTRTFQAPRQLVFDAFTKPEMVKRWLWGPPEWPMVHCEIDLRVGGTLRYVWRHSKKGDMGMSGVFRAIEAPALLANTEIFDEDWTGGETLVTTTFAEQNGRTTVAATVRYSSPAAREVALKTPMLEGWSQGHDRLDDLLASMVSAQINTSNGTHKENTMRVEPYLFFDGRCEEAIEFYKKTLGAEVGMLMRFKENPEPPPGGFAAGTENKVMHASITIRGTNVMASDGHAKGKPHFEGFSLSFPAKDEGEADKIFGDLSKGGQVQMPLTKTFFSPRFGMVADKFGVSWMVIVCETPAKAESKDFVISRVFDAPRELVWKAFTDPKRMKEWWGPKGFTVLHSKMDLRPGGTYHYGMQSPQGMAMWGKFTYREIVPNERIVLISSFSDEEGGITRHPMAPTWPMLMRSTFTFDDEPGGKTKLTIRWQAYQAAPEEQRTFDAGHASMTQGWTGTLDQLTAYLAKAAKSKPKTKT